MAKMTNNNIKINGRIISTQNQEICFVFNDANQGWQFTVIQAELLPNNTINRVIWKNASKTHVSAIVEPLVEQLYKGKTALPLQTSATVTIGNYRPILAKDLSEGFITGKWNFELASKKAIDCNNMTLEAYMLQTFGYPDPNNPGAMTIGFTLQDYTITGGNVAAQHFDAYDMISHKPWDNIAPEEAENFKVHTNDVLKNAVKNSVLYKKLMAHLLYNDRATNQKGMAIYGDPGTGKTTAVRVLAEELDLPYAAITGNPAVTIEDLFGFVIPNDAAGDPKPWVTQWTNVLKCAQAGGIIVLDEANNFSLAVQIGLNNVVYGAERFITFQNKTFKVHPKTVFVVTTNFREQGNNPMNGAFKDRFEPFEAVEFNAKEYAEYLISLYPTINPKGLQSYVNFMYKAIQDTRATFENQDQYSPDTPCFRTRDISRVLVRAFTFNSLRQALGDTLAAHTVGVEDNHTKVKAFLEKNSSDILKIEQQFFVDPNKLKASDALAKELYTIGSANVQTNTGNSTDANDILSKASKISGDNAADIIDSAGDLW